MHDHMSHKKSRTLYDTPTNMLTWRYDMTWYDSLCDSYQHLFQWISESFLVPCLCSSVVLALCAASLPGWALSPHLSAFFVSQCWDHSKCPNKSSSSAGPPKQSVPLSNRKESNNSPKILGRDLPGKLDKKLHPHLSPAVYTQEPQFFQLTHPSHRAAATNFRIPNSWSHTAESPCSNQQLKTSGEFVKKNKNNVQPMQECDTEWHERLDWKPIARFSICSLTEIHEQTLDLVGLAGQQTNNPYCSRSENFPHPTCPRRFK